MKEGFEPFKISLEKSDMVICEKKKGLYLMPQFSRENSVPA